MFNGIFKNGNHIVNYMLRKSVFQKVSDNMQKSVGAVLTVSNWCHLKILDTEHY